MKLYHGTTNRFLALVQKQGLRPRNRRSSNWNENPSRPDMVYLTSAYPFYFATITPEEPKVVVFEIDAKKLDQTRLYPDEDYIGELIRVRDGGLPTEEQKRHVRDDLDLFQHLWRKSLAFLGNCAYRGTIPLKAITRYCHFDSARRPDLKFQCMDASISVLNYRFQGKEFEQVVAWFFGDRKLLPMVEDAETGKEREFWLRQSQDRTGIDVVVR